jgi:serine/threonine-protein kinase
MSDLGQGSTVAGKYRLERLIGRGGMGSVWAARHLQLDTLVAVKFIDSVSDVGDARVRFEREARAAAQLRSPHVVQILDHGIDDDERPYIAMELLEGEDLGERLRRTPKLSLQATATIVTQAAKALRRAHDGGVIHRDLKPGNIFLARFDDDEVVKLLDFGVAKLRYNELAPGVQMTQTGVIFGSPSYMSPEQARGNRVIDHRTDLWSLAVIVFRCITGTKPFEAGSIGDLVIKLCIDPLPMPTRVAPELPAEMDRFFERAFARDPEQRFQSAAALALEFEAIVARSSATASAAAAVSAPAPAPAAPFAVPPPPPPSSSGSRSDPFARPTSGLGVSARIELAIPRPAALEDPTTTPLPTSSPTGIHRAPPSAPSAPRFGDVPPSSPSAPFGAATGGYAAPPMDPPPPTPQPASMTPSPALLPVTTFAASLPARGRLIAAASLGGFALFFLAIVIGVARHRGATPTPASGVEAPDLASASAPIAPAPPPVESAVAPAPASAQPEPAASVAEPEPAASVAEPAASAAPVTSASGRKPGSGKPGHGRRPNFGY